MRDTYSHIIWRGFAACLVLALLLCAAPAPLPAAETVITLEPLEPEAPAPAPAPAPARWNLSADYMSTLANNTVVEAKGGVVLTRGADELRADFARYFTETGWVYLQGNVFIRVESDTINAEEAEFDLRNQVGWLKNGVIFVEGTHMYVKGEDIVKHDKSRYTFKEAKLTTCDGLNPAWSVNANRITMELDGYAQLYHTNVAIKDTGVFYSPFLMLPAKTTRQSGLLLPDYGYSSRRGMYLTLPFYWVVDDTSDMTFYVGGMTKRGPSYGVEYRSMPYTSQKTWLMFSGMHDNDTITLPGTGPVDRSSSAVRTNRDRYWLRGMADGELGASGWQYRTNIDFVSDQDYLREFNSGMLSYSRSRNQLYSMFGRDLAEEDRNRVSEGILAKDWDRFGVALSARYEQDPSLGHGNAPRSSDTLTQRLPQLDAFLYKGGLFDDLPLEAEAQFTTGYLYRRSGTSGLRTELTPKLSMPLNLKYLSVIPTVGVRQTWYSGTSVDHSYDEFSNSLDTNPYLTGRTRTVPEVNVQAYTDANRVWQLDNPPMVSGKADQGYFAGWVGLRHDIQLRASYDYVRDVNQADNPFYTDSDRLLSTSELTYSITNILTRKRAVQKPKPQNALHASPLEGVPAQAESDVAYDYHDLVRWKLEWGYDFEERRRDEYLDLARRRPLKDILSELTLSPVDWFAYTGKTYLSPYTGALSRHDHTVSFRWQDKLSWSTSLDYRTEDYNRRESLRRPFRNGRPNLTTPVRQLRNVITIQPVPNWALSLLDYRDLRKPGTLGSGYEKAATLSYRHQCYTLIFEYRYDNFDSSYSVFLQIPGLFEPAGRR